MGRAARLYDHGAARLLLEERDQLVARHLALELDLALRVDAMEMKDRLGDVDADHANAHSGRLPCCGFLTTASWHTDAVGGRPPCTLRDVWLAEVISWPGGPSCREQPS